MKGLTKEGGEKVVEAKKALTMGQSLVKEKDELLALASEGKGYDEQKLLDKYKEIEANDALIEAELGKLSLMQEQALYTSVQVDQVKEVVKEDEKRLEVGKKIEKNLGVMGGILAGMGALLSKIQGATKGLGSGGGGGGGWAPQLLRPPPPPP